MAERNKSEQPKPAARPRSKGPAAGAGRPPRRLPSHELLGREEQVIIEHGGREYRLRVTSNGKLILTA